MDDILQILRDNWWSGPFAFVVFLLGYFFTHPEKISIWSSMVASIFEKISSRSARHSVSSDIQSRISSYIKNNNVDAVLPYGLKFKWIKDDNFSSYVDEKDVIVIMDYHKNNARNFLNAIDQYLSKAFLTTIRQDMPSNVLTAAELTMKEKIIREKRPDAWEFFTKEMLPEHTAQNDGIGSVLNRFRNLDVKGYFDNIFLSELAFVGSRLQWLDNNQKTVEINAFLSFLEGIEDENVPLDYHGEIFCVQIILVAKLSTKVFGTEAYLNRAQIASREKTNSIYVSGWERNMEFVDEVVERIKNNDIGRLEWIKSYKTLDKKRKKKNARMALFRL